MRGAAQVEWFGNKVTEARLSWSGHVQRRDGGCGGQKVPNVARKTTGQGDG